MYAGGRWDAWRLHASEERLALMGRRHCPFALFRYPFVEEDDFGFFSIVADIKDCGEQGGHRDIIFPQIGSRDGIKL